MNRMNKALICLAALSVLLLCVSVNAETFSTDGFSYMLEDGKAVITGYDGEDETLNIPESIDGYAVRAVRELGFQSGISHIFIPDSVSLEDNPFGLCYSLEKIMVSDSHPDLMLKDDILFSKDGKTLICFPCIQVDKTQYVVPEGTEIIGEDAFAFCSLLESVEIPDSVREIRSFAFGWCSKLEKINLPDTVHELGKMAFGHSGLKSLDLSKLQSVTEVSDLLCYGCWALSEVTLHDDIRRFGNEAFAFSALKEITLPSGLESIGINPFHGCGELTDIRTGGGSAVVFEYPFLTSVTDSRLVCAILNGQEEYPLPEVEKIGDFSFHECVWLKSLQIPESIICVGEGAFSGCSALRLVCAETGEELIIRDMAFSNCRSLECVVVNRPVIMDGNKIFDDDPKLSEVRSTSESFTAYCMEHGIPAPAAN